MEFNLIDLEGSHFDPSLYTLCIIICKGINFYAASEGRVRRPEQLFSKLCEVLANLN